MHKPTTAELVNDPSLRWHKYKRGEALYCEIHGIHVRFDRYVGNRIAVLELDSMRPMKATFPILHLRRLTAR